VTEPRDEIDNWLSSDVGPLAPLPGTFDRVHRRAGRRKLNQALFAAAGAVVVIAGAVLVPTLAPGLLPGPSGSQPPAAAGSSPPRTVTITPKAASSAPTVSATGTPSVLPTGTALSDTTSGTAAPANFQPASITMIGRGVGAVIGQAGTAGHCGPPVANDCTSLAGTSDYGTTWYGVSAPVTGVPEGSTGVSQLRFLNLKDGWAFGPALQETSDGGRTWTAEQTFGLRVTGLETAGDRAFALLGSCQSVGSPYAADCSKFSIYSSAAGSTSWQPVRLSIPASLRSGAMGTAGQASSASLVIRGNAASPQAGTGYLLAPSGDILTGSVGGGAWAYAGKAPCLPGTAASGGAPLGAQLTVGGAGLRLNCATGTGSAAGSTQPKQLWQSADGAQWTKVSRPPATGAANSLAATSSGHVVLATTAGIDYSATGTTWQPTTISGGSPQGGFSYVGMTSDTQGVALPVDSRLGEVFITRDGGQTWTPSPVSG
jgi:hypothetical protein